MSDRILLRSSPHAEPFRFHQWDPCAILFAQLLELSLFYLTCFALLEVNIRGISFCGEPLE